MTLLPTTHGLSADIVRSAPHPLQEAEPARAARFAEGVRPAASSALLRTTVNGLVAATSISVFLAALLIWSAVLTGRL